MMWAAAVLVILGLDLPVLAQPLPEGATAMIAVDDEAVPPQGYFRWSCRWQIDEVVIDEDGDGDPDSYAQPSVRVVSPIDGLVPTCFDVVPGPRQFWVAIPIDELHQDVSSGYRLQGNSEPGCTGVDLDTSEFACVPVVEPQQMWAWGLALFAGMAGVQRWRS